MKASILDDRAATAEIDRSNMLQTLEETPETYEQAYAAALKSKNLPRPFSRLPSSLALVGMGGSAITGDILKDWLLEGRVPIEVMRGLRLPGSVTASTCVLLTSYSGQTSETLKALSEVRRRKSRIACTTSGGEMLKVCREERISHVQVRAGLQPRAALPHLISASLAILEGWRICSRRTTYPELRTAIEEMKELRNVIGFARAQTENPAKQLAVQLCGRIPFIYASELMTAVGRRFKNQLNENSKILSKFEVIPEMLHNEVEAWRMLREDRFADSVSFVFLRASEKEAELFERLMGLIREAGSKAVHEIYLESPTKLATILATIYYCDYVSFYLAIARGFDPTRIDMISSLKQPRSQAA